MNSIKIKYLNELASEPTRGTEYSAGLDLYAAIVKPLIIEPHKTKKVSTALAMEIPEGYFGGVFARSGLATNKGLRPANCVGIVDSDYRGEIFISLHNDTDEPQVILPKDRIAQLIILPFVSITEFEEVDELEDTNRGEGGFGSTGI